MKRGVTFFITMFMLLSFVYGEVQSDAVKNIQKVRGLSGLFTKDQKLPQKVVVNQTRQTVSPAMRVRREIMNRSEKHSPATITKSELIGPFKTARLEKSVVAYDTLKFIPGETHEITYTAGATFVLQALTNEPLQIEFFVDDGDGVFNPENDRMVNMGADGGNWLIDGEEPDETPAGDGVIMFHVNTGAMDDVPGVFLALQNTKIWVLAVQASSGAHAFGLANILPINENTSIGGKVTFADNTPAPWQVVVAVPADSMDNPAAIFLTLTDATGNYYLGIPDALAGKYMVMTLDFWGDFPGFFPNRMFQEVVAMGHLTGVNFQLVEATAKIVGYVTTNTGTPVFNIEVVAKLRDMGDMFYASGTTDNSGYYEINVTPGEWRVNINQESLNGDFLAAWYWESIFVQERQTANRDFVVYPCDGYFSGNVMFSSGTPVEGANVFAEIWIQDQTGNYRDFWVETKTDQSGDYLLRVSKALQKVAPGDTVFYYVGAWYEEGLIVPWGYNVLADAAGLNFTVYNTDVVFSGKVFDRNTMKPLYDAGVRAYSLNKSGAGFETWDYTDEGGNFELPLIGGAPNGILYGIEIYWPNNYSRPALWDSLNAVSGNTYYQEYYINEPQNVGSVFGYVYDAWFEYPIQGALVEFQTRTKALYSAYTDGNGYYQINEIPAGDYYAKATATGYIPQDMTVYIGPWNNQYNFWLNQVQPKLSGIVKDASTNAPLGNSIVFLKNEWGDWIDELITDETGYYEFYVNTGVYSLVAGHNGYYLEKIDSLIVEGDQVLDIALNKATIAGNISGHVVDFNYAPVQDAWVYVESENYLAWSITDQMGWYEIPLVEGQYDAVIGAEGYHEEYRYFSFPGGGLEEPIMLFGYDVVYGPKLISVVDIPADQGKQVRLTWIPDPNISGMVKEYYIYRAIQRFEGPDPKPNQQFTWDFVAVVPFNPEFSEYNFVAPTLYDKVGDDIHWTGFMVTAVAWDNWSYWDSNLKAGWSEDNLAPEVPKNLSGDKVGGQIVVKWEEVTSEEIKYYTVYRKIGTGDFTRLAYTTKPEFVDSDVAATGVYTYSVTATDFGLNESEQSAPVVVTIVATADEKRVPDKYSLAQNFPNPFNPSTRIEFGLPKSGEVALTIYNLMGQVVREYRLQLPAGYGHVVWDGCDNYGNQVGSGVYIYTMATKDFKQTRKMILMR